MSQLWLNSHSVSVQLSSKVSHTPEIHPGNELGENDGVVAAAVMLLACCGSSGGASADEVLVPDVLLVVVELANTGHPCTPLPTVPAVSAQRTAGEVWLASP